MTKPQGNEQIIDVVMIGAGIMSATLATLLTELEPGQTIQVFERLEGVARESSAAMNNAGTGHAANCELNYTPEKADGTVDITKALSINASFETSLQFWSYLLEKGTISSRDCFFTQVPHLSAVWGEDNVRFLHARQAQLRTHPMFQEMRISEDHEELKEWIPLMMKERQPGPRFAVTRVTRATDLNFGCLTQMMFAGLEKLENFKLHLGHEVRDLKRAADGRWSLKVKDIAKNETREIHAKFVFIGAGGGALPLLMKSGIPEGLGYGGYPVSGQFLVCSNPDVIAQHHAKVYGKAALGAPPMSVPHLDTRMINEQKVLLFGPFAGFTTKFLKAGSFLDLPKGLSFSNIKPMLAAGWHNLGLTGYLIGQALQSPQARLRALQEFMPTARFEDWKLTIAGQRVQIIKKDAAKGGKLEMGTEVVAAADGSLAALLGASPGASTAVSAMVDLVKRCFKTQVQTEAWQTTLKRMIPSFGQDLTKDADLLRTVRDRNNAVLGFK